MPKIDGERVLADLKRLAEFGRYKTGVHRPTYSPVDVASRHWLADKFREAGLDPVIDGIGNVIGRDPAGATPAVGRFAQRDPAAWRLARRRARRHLRAGAGPRLCRRSGLRHRGRRLGGRGGPLRQYARQPLVHRRAPRRGDRPDPRPRRRHPLREALARAGFAGRPRERVDPSRYVGYLEAHIEQGDTLDTTGLRIGVVETIVGIWNYRVALIGEQNHAGTTRMVRRRDAGVAMVRLAARIHDRFAEIAGPRTVWTIGRMLLEPNAPSVVPGRAEMLVQFRDTDIDRLAALEKTLQELVGETDRAGPCACQIEATARTEPRPMDPGFQDQIEAAAERHAPGKHMRMPSAAGHDAAVLSYRMPSGMMFIPSLRGISHHWSEDTKEEDIVLGAQVFADAAERILCAAK